METHDLERFVVAQDRDGACALGELRRGRKESHWMWFVFPQIAGLGHSAMAQRYAIADLDEAKRYLQHPVLGPRIRECVSAVAASSASSAEEIFGAVDAMKLRSSLTLFMRAAPDERGFAELLERFFGGAADDRTEARLR